MERTDIIEVKNKLESRQLFKVSPFKEVIKRTRPHIVKKANGKSASELIAEQVLLEAKRYLIHTDNTVSEIACSLVFAGSSHFVKHFKKSTGETPQTFRTRHFQ